MPQRKADVHTHLLPREIPDFKKKFGYGGFIRLEHEKGGTASMVRDDGKFFRKVGSELWDAKVRLTQADKSGVEVQVLSTVPVMFSYWAKPKDGLELSQFLNDDLAGVVRANPSRFAGLATLPLQAPALAAKELERCVNELGLAGAQIGSNVEGKNLDDESLRPVFETAERLGAALFVHPWDMMGQDQMQKYWLPWLVGMPAELSRAICSMLFGGVFDRYPKLRVAFAHGGGAFCATLGRIEHGYKARPDLCAVDGAKNPRSYLGKFWVDSLVHDADMLRHVLKVFGGDKVALGTDYPFPLGEENPGELIASLKLPARIEHRLLWDNAMTWLGRKA